MSAPLWLVDATDGLAAAERVLVEGLQEVADLLLDIEGGDFTEAKRRALVLLMQVRRATHHVAGAKFTLREAHPAAAAGEVQS
jgi:hypothetical protein